MTSPSPSVGAKGKPDLGGQSGQPPQPPPLPTGEVLQPRWQKLVDNANVDGFALGHLCKRLMDGASLTEIKDQQIKSTIAKAKGSYEALKKNGLEKHYRPGNLVEAVAHVRNIRNLVSSTKRASTTLSLSAVTSSWDPLFGPDTSLMSIRPNIWPCREWVEKFLDLFAAQAHHNNDAPAMISFFLWQPHDAAVPGHV